MQELTIMLFIDYDNLQPNQKVEGILDIATKILIQSGIPSHIKRANCHIRIYGGWFEGSVITRNGEELAVEIQSDFPKIIRIPTMNNEYIKINTSAELAVSLLQDPSYHLFNTFRRKGRPKNIRVVKSDDIDCSETECLLPLLRNLFKKGKCPKGSCNNREIIYRSEQKIVDTMLTCDLMFSADTGGTSIILVSSDDDFLPPLRSIVLRGVEAIRVHPKRNNQRVNYNQGNVQFSELEL